MAAIRVALMPEFKGGDVVLVAVDSDGLEAVRSALVEAPVETLFLSKDEYL